MRQVSMATRDELLAALTVRYEQAGREDKARILTEFVAVTGYHRKHAARLLRGGSRKDRSAAVIGGGKVHGSGGIAPLRAA